LNYTIMLNENVDIATRKGRLGHIPDRVNPIYSHAGDQALVQVQVAASEVPEKSLRTAREEVLKRVTVHQTVHQKMDVPISP
jgi:hypothetical protein